MTHAVKGAFGAPVPPHFGAGQHRRITVDAQGKWRVPNHVRIPVLPGDGIGPEIMAQTQRVVDSAVKEAYGDKRSIKWFPLIAGEKAIAAGKDPLPPETIKAIDTHHIAVKSPLNTPTGGGFRSINVTLRKMFDLFACIRPVKVLPGVVTPMKQDKLDVVIFRENSGTDDLYAGIEFEKGSDGAQKLRDFLKNELKIDVPADAGFGIKPASESASKRIVAKAIAYAIEHGRPTVTIVHKGNIQKYTDGAFLKWGREVAKEKFGDKVLFWEEFKAQYNADFKKLPKGKVVLQDRIADAMFQDITLSPQSHSVIVTMNLNGDYLSDDAAANVGGLGLAPGANIGDRHAIFEATHGTAPDIAGQDKANPTALLLSTLMMLNHMGWTEAGDKLLKGIEATLAQHRMTGDLARHVPGATPLGTSAFSDAVIENMRKASGAKSPAA